MEDVKDRELLDFPIPRQCPMHAPKEYDKFRKTPPAKVRFWNGNEAWIFTKYNQVKSILSDNRFSVVPTRSGFPSLSPGRDAITLNDPTFLRLDPPEHDVYRRMVTKEFMVKNIAAMKPHLAEIVDELLTEMERKGPPSDLVQDLALPLTSRVITDMLGVPYADREFFNEQSRIKAINTSDPSIPLAAQAATLAYLDNLLREREANPGQHDDLIDRLVRDHVLPGHLSHDLAVKMCDLMMMAGHETTANQICLGVMAFVEHPEQLKRLRADPDLLPNAIEEMLRYHTIVQFNGMRLAIEDVEIDGHVIREGEGVLAMITGANHDPEMFDDPNTFEIGRDTTGHIAFSFGVHQCLGQNLARAELEAVFSVIFDRLPNLGLAADTNKLQYKTESIVMGVESLPVTWG